MIVHQWRHRKNRKGKLTALAHQVELVLLDRNIKRMPLFFAPARDETVDGDRIHHRAGQNMSANFCALFKNNNVHVRIKLFKPNCRCETGRSASHDYNIKFHSLARLEILAHGKLLLAFTYRLVKFRRIFSR